MKVFLRKLWRVVNSPLFDFVGGIAIAFGAIFYFIGYLQISVDPLTFIFAALLVIGMDCMENGAYKLFYKKNK